MFINVGQRILIVDDDEIIRFAVERYFTKLGYEVVPAETFEEARAMLSERRFALVITDLRLGGTDSAEGFEIVELVRVTAPGTRTIIFTAHESPQIKAEALKRGADRLLHKTIRLPDLAQSVSALLAEEMTASPVAFSPLTSSVEKFHAVAPFAARVESPPQHSPPLDRVPAFHPAADLHADATPSDAPTPHAIPDFTPLEPSTGSNNGRAHLLLGRASVRLAARIREHRLFGRVISEVERRAEGRPVAWWSWIALFALFIYMALVSVDVRAQVVISVAALGLMLLLRKSKQAVVRRNVFFLLGSFLSLRYFFWRTFDTLTYVDFLSFGAAILLYLAEVYGITIYVVSMFVNVAPLEREPAPLPKNQDEWPTVDIMVPSYNEDPDILEVTLLAATQVRYPERKFNVYLLDDGGTVQRRNDRDPAKAAAARQRYETLRSLSAHIGATYVTREKNVHAKAGNINSGLAHSNGDLVLILDADHVPAADILEKTVGLFLQDEKMFLVQTPHFFINPDPIERNLDTFQTMPSENEMFYRVIQKGLDFWGASFFCGSAALLRRKYLTEIGGICGESITEDAETALELHSRGYHSAYIQQPMIAGLQPESFNGFVVQRTRWAQGMVQIFILKNPLFKKGLTLAQRLCYFNSSFFWFFAYSRIVFLLAPAAYLLLGLQIYRTDFLHFLGYAVPHLIGAFLVQDYLFGRVRWIIMSELYELMQAVFALPGIIKVFINPRAPSFAVTPKGEQLNEDFISPLSFRFYVLLLLNIVCIIVAAWRYTSMPQEQGAVVITAGWAVFNVFLTLAALGVLRERSQRRSVPRVPTRTGATIIGEGLPPVPGMLHDFSVSGARIVVDHSYQSLLENFEGGSLRVHLPTSGVETDIEFIVRNRFTAGNGYSVGVQFRPQTADVRADIIELMYARSERWNRFQTDRRHAIGIFGGLGFFMKRGIVNSASHLKLLAESAGKNLSVQTARLIERQLKPALDSTKAKILQPANGHHRHHHHHPNQPNRLPELPAQETVTK
ncbi:MAG: UDP-forming cellulose synthase catalytic subunit [Pyrinomonadaceae bacterium]|nr:UDP-forming cellulose synthase catalytic subunit [Pyrinomonadaceae bacterium]